MTDKVKERLRIAYNHALHRMKGHAIAINYEAMEESIRLIEQEREYLNETLTPAPVTVDVDVLNNRIDAAKKRLGDAKALHSNWYTMPKYLADQFAADNMSNIEQIIYSAICYLDGLDGPYLKPASGHLTAVEERGEAKAKALKALENLYDEKGYFKESNDKIARFVEIYGKAIKAALCAPPVDLEKLKREIINKVTLPKDDEETEFHDGMKCGISKAIDYLAANYNITAKNPTEQP